MTGAVIRIEREGQLCSVELDQLTDAELDWFSAQQPNAGWKWAKFLARWIRDNVKDYDPTGGSESPEADRSDG